jgi:hypothetical protein
MALQNLAARKLLHQEPTDEEEVANLVHAAADRLRDAQNGSLSYASRFDLAYNAAHGLALAALRSAGYRTDKRYLVFQCLIHTSSLSKSTVRLFSACHDKRNLAEYTGHFEVDYPLLEALIESTAELSRLIDNRR